MCPCPPVRRRLRSRGPLFPLQRPALPDIHVADREDDHDPRNLRQQEPGPGPGLGPAAPVDHGPWDQERRLDIKNDEQHRHHAELQRKPLVGVAEREHAACIGGILDRGGPVWRQQMRRPDHPERGERRDTEENQEGDIGRVHEFVKKFTYCCKRNSRTAALSTEASGVSVDGADILPPVSIKSDRWIRRMAAAPRMITPCADNKARPGAISSGVSSYGYDMRVAPEFRIFTNALSAIVDPKAFDPKSFVEFTGDVCIVPPNSFALGRSVEYFRIPRNVLTICVGKSTYARCGIITNVTPFEPAWAGYVTLDISNTTPLPARSYANEGIAQVLFFTADEGDECEVSYKDKKGKYQAQQGITLPKL